MNAGIPSKALLSLQMTRFKTVEGNYCVCSHSTFCSRLMPPAVELPEKVEFECNTPGILPESKLMSFQTGEVARTSGAKSIKEEKPARPRRTESAAECVYLFH